MKSTPRSEDTNIVANPLFLVLSNALGDPRYVPDFLNSCQPS